LWFQVSNCTVCFTLVFHANAESGVDEYIDFTPCRYNRKTIVQDLKASALEDTITATATLTEIDGRRLVFEVVANDSKGIIGEGTHERFVINVEKFLSKLK
jgi:predicted thioesterase